MIQLKQDTSSIYSVSKEDMINMILVIGQCLIHMIKSMILLINTNAHIHITIMHLTLILTIQIITLVMELIITSLYIKSRVIYKDRFSQSITSISLIKLWDLCRLHKRYSISYMTIQIVII